LRWRVIRTIKSRGLERSAHRARRFGVKAARRVHKAHDMRPVE
jgi:hypothetical protein